MSRSRAKKAATASSVRLVSSSYEFSKARIDSAYLSLAEISRSISFSYSASFALCSVCSSACGWSVVSSFARCSDRFCSLAYLAISAFASADAAAFAAPSASSNIAFSASLSSRCDSTVFTSSSVAASTCACSWCIGSTKDCSSLSLAISPSGATISVSNRVSIPGMFAASCSRVFSAITSAAAAAFSAAASCSSRSRSSSWYCSRAETTACSSTNR
mmetsp:Transcript_11008/g.24602  ORF Transcript_11008/g.24602 Transcript_11008/m.24602 type:complete len:217 (-) Transcript_11008:762-1412(-)